MPESMRYTIAISGAVAIVGLILWWAWPYLERVFTKKPIALDKNSKTQVKTARISTHVSPMPNYKKVLGILGQEPSNKPSVLMKAISTVCSLIILTYGLLMLNLWHTGKLIMQTSWFLFICFLIVFPVLILLDIWLWENKYYKLNKSAVEKHKTFTLHGNLDEVFNSCLKVLKERIRSRENSRILKMERPEFIKALIGGFIITVETRQVEEGVAEIYFQSDSQWLTTKFDSGTNQKNIETFEGLILAELGK